MQVNSVTNTSNFQKGYQYSEKAWSYLGRIGLLARQILNALAKACQSVSLGLSNGTLLNVVTKLKFLSIVGVPFTVVQSKNQIQKIVEAARAKQPEGVALNTLSFTMSAMDIVDSLATFINAAVFTATHVAVPFLTEIGMPFGFGLNGLALVSRIIQLAKTHAIFKRIHGENYRDLLPISQKESEELLRTMSEPIKGAYEKFLSHLKSGEQEETLQSLESLRRLLKHKMWGDVGHLITHVLNLVALVLFLVVVPASLPFIILGVSLILKLSTLAFQDLAK